MELFRHRPLFFFCAAFTLTSVGGYILFDGRLGFAVSSGAVFLCAVSVLTVCFAVAALFFAVRRQKFRAFAVGIGFVSALLGLLSSCASFAGEETIYLRELTGETVTVRAVVTERRGEGGYLSSFALELQAVNGKETDALAVLTCHYLADLSPGDVVELSCMVISLEESAGDGYSAGALRGDGFSLGLLSESEADIASVGRVEGNWRVRVDSLRRTLSARLKLLVGDASAGLPSAFLLGDRSALREDVRRDFARAGTSHLLAISGLHMTLLFGLLDGVLRFLRLSKRLRAVLLGVLAVGYLVLLGFPPSATRAVVMLGMVYLSTLLSAQADPLTSLGVAGVLILAVSPHTVADAGFWMSYLATLGLVSVMPWVNTAVSRRLLGNRKNGLCRRLILPLVKLGVGLLVGVVAMSCTLFVVAAVMGETSLLSPLSTLILTPLCGAVLLLSLLCLPLSATILGVWLGRAVAAISSLMADIAAWLSKPRWVVISLVHPAILPIAMLMTAGLLALLCMRLPVRRRWWVLLPLLVGWTTIVGVVAVTDAVDGNTPSVSFLQPSAQSDMLVLTEGRDAVICDLSNGSLSAFTAASTEASRRGATEIAALMLTHYHRRTVGTLGTFLSRETVRELWVPLPTTDEEYGFLLAYIEQADAAGVPVVLYEEGERLRVFGGCELSLHTAALSRSEQSVLLLTLDVDPLPDRGGELVYCGTAVFESSLADTATYTVSRADAVIFGNHGPLPKESFGDGFSYYERVSVVLSEHGDVPAYFDADALPDGAELWLGQWRFEWKQKTQ